MRFALVQAFIVFITSAGSLAAQQYPPELFENAGDYSYMWWKDGFRGSEKVFNIQTGSYGLSFDYDDFNLISFGAIPNPPAESEALRADNSVINSLPAASLTCGIEVNAAQYNAVSAGPGLAGCMLIESGKFFQRRWLENITLESAAPAGEMQLEIAAWPDRISFVLYFTPQETITNGSLILELDLDQYLPTLIDEAMIKGLCDSQGQNGFVFTSDHSAASLTCDTAESKCRLRLNIENWQAGTEQSIALVVYPESDNFAAKLEDVIAAETTQISINAQQTQPLSRGLTTYYKRRYGWYHIGLRNDFCGTYQQSGNDRIERVEMLITNPTTVERKVRLSFYKDGNVCQVVGLSAVLCDSQYNPLGIPIQLSKNWHNSDTGGRFDSTTWFRGSTIITIPPQTTLELSYTSVGAHWGGVAAASHAQLCLAGWSDSSEWGNQLWEESALGSWAETITYDPDVCLNRSMIDDCRPIMVYAMNRDEPVKWSWTNNVGGCDFLAYWNGGGERQYNRNMKTLHKKNCPVITEAIYSGDNSGAIDMKCTAGLYRSDDIVRAVYKLRYDVTNNLPVDASPAGNSKRIAFFQLGADNYNNHNFNKMARGDINGMIEEWNPVKGGNDYSRVAIPCTGETPWFSLHEANSKDTSVYGAWANRGLVIREYSARLGGVETQTPLVSVYGTENGGYKSANLELSVPDNITELIPGDYLEAQIVYLIVPQYAEDYYGPNTQLNAALAANPDSWEIIYRETAGNDVQIQMIRGRLVQNYPLIVKVCGGAEFEITGGIGYFPITIENLPASKGYRLEQNILGEWIPIDQSVHGSDFWQCNYDAACRSWSLSFTVPFDTENDQRTTRHFRLTGPYLSETGSDLNCDNRVDPDDLRLFASDWLDTYQSETGSEFDQYCLGWWKFDETSGTAAFDSSGNEHNAAVNIDTAWTEGRDGNALNFTGNTTAAVPQAALSSLSDEVTICLWVYGDPAYQPDNPDVVFHGNGADKSRILLSHLPWSSGLVVWDAGFAEGSYDRISKTAVQADYSGRWNHWAFTKNCTTAEMKMYLNGSLWHSGTGKTKPMTDITSFNIGSYAGAQGSGDGFYRGMIDDFRIYAKELSSEDIYSIYQDISPEPECTAMIADLDGNCKVDLEDFGLLVKDWLLNTE
ncbi:hypothetical protein SMSP2_02623 [Limihaloglobus sulfuriphilus]|uniref:LamG-like jellyroll fold domain-containing protein n=1 Tax=Limihaloglobus sulfuriphilus TaxID=1851148 RepID=A0A1Q2MIX3_9BACT|nr:LamG domain-containing protein [Limihaloglobus sulfuriphilus]AQQ72242.1 hypothetical protein SMSP2_02623 [Limihaloglobus sulfuriphilus]